MKATDADITKTVMFKVAIKPIIEIFILCFMNAETKVIISGKRREINAY